jgi:hypothetical protein
LPLISPELLLAFSAYLEAANATALVVQTAAFNAAYAVSAESDARLLVSNNLIVAAETVRWCLLCALALRARCMCASSLNCIRSPVQAVNDSAAALWLSYETVRINTETAELASEATMTDDAALVSRTAADAAAAVALSNYLAQALVASVAAAAAKLVAATAAAAASATAAAAALAAALTASDAAAAAAALALAAALAALGATSAP